MRTVQARRAFTLMELTVSLAICAMLMAALGSAVAIAAAALPEPNSSETRILDSSRALERLSADLEGTLYVLDTTPNAPLVGIPDRNKDGAPDTLALTWSGSRTDPIQVVENGATPEAVLDNASAFTSSFNSVVVTEEFPSSLMTSAETEIASYPVAPTATSDVQIKQQLAYAQAVTPSFSADTTAWVPTRAEFLLARFGGANSEIVAQILAAGPDGEPTGLPLSEVSVLESDLGVDFAWVEVVFAGAPSMTPGDSVFLVLGDENDTRSGLFQVEDGSGSGLWQKNASADDTWVADWSPWNLQMLYRLYGTYTSPSAGGSVTHHFAVSAEISLSASGDPDVDLNSTMNLINRPQILRSIWEAEFGTDPTVHDINADGVEDWARPDFGAFDTGALAGGGWTATTSLMTQPPKDLTGPVVAEIRWRCLNLGQPGARWVLSFDQGGGQQGVMQLTQALTGADEQTLEVTSLGEAGSDIVLTTAALDTGWTELRVVIDPVNDAVSIRADGVELGAFSYQKRTYTDDQRVSVVQPLGAGVEIDYVRIREGGTP